MTFRFCQVFCGTILHIFGPVVTFERKMHLLSSGLAYFRTSS